VGAKYNEVALSHLSAAGHQNAEGDVLQTGSAYLHDVLYDQDMIIRNAFTALDGVEFDSVVGTGVSGALILPRFAVEFAVPFMLVRTHPAEHSAYLAEGRLGRRWLFLDDKIVTGATLDRVKEAVVKIAGSSGGFKTECVGAYLYSTNHYQEEWE
jgi:hypothetical protein